jgi:diphthamide synthase (EF-2-diphthine--ammonia ligase)
MRKTPAEIASFVDRCVETLKISEQDRAQTFGYLNSLPGSVSEFAESQGQLTQAEAMEAIADGYDLESVQQHKRIERYASQHSLEYSEALHQLYQSEVSNEVATLGLPKEQYRQNVESQILDAMGRGMTLDQATDFVGIPQQ